MVERKRFLSRKASAIAFKVEKEFFVPGSRDQAASSLDWFSLARARFARHRTDKPATKAGQIRALWPDIEAALDGGQSMKSIRKWLEEDAGVTLSITSLTSYISRIRRHLKAKRSAEVATGQIITASRATWTKHAFVGYESANRGAPRPNTTRSLKPNALSLSRNSISASSITTVIPKAEI